jgi:hypothetical protein
MKRLIILFLLIPSLCFGANKTINDLTDLGEKPATDDEFVLWDSSLGATKKVDFSYLSDIQNVDEFGGLTSAVASFGATPVSLLIDTTQTVSDNLSIPTTMQLVGLRSGSISVASGKVLTLNSCPSLPPDYQFFTGSGTVTNNCAYFIPGAWTGGSGVDFTSATHDHSNNANGGTIVANYVKVSDVKASGNSGGTFTSGAWQTRDINTEDTDTDSLASISSNQITLAAGTYECLIRAQAYQVNAHQLRLYDTTGTAVLLLGGTMFTASGDGVVGDSVIQGRFTLSVQSVLEVQHRCGTTKATNGLGVASNWGDEIYTVAEFWRD